MKKDTMKGKGKAFIIALAGVLCVALPDTLLNKNSDTIFGGSFVWEEE